MEIKMNKLVLTLTFGVLASSAFASNLQTNVQNAETAVKSGQMSQYAPAGKNFVKTEKGQNDLSYDAKSAAGMAQGGVMTKDQVISSGKNAMGNNH